MKKIIYYALLMIIIVVILPLLIVRGCSTSEENKLPEQKQEGIKIKVYISSEKKVSELMLEDYIKGVVAAEMPAEFEPEALMAQAVAARTYALARIMKLYLPKEDLHNGADICTDPGHCQAWISKSNAMKKWNIFYTYRNWGKVERAVAETQNIIAIYNNTPINPLYHSNSGGRTENSEDVWEGIKVEYLRSVPSSGEDACPGFKTEILVKTRDFSDKLKKLYPDIKLNSTSIIENVKIQGYTEGGRVETIKVGNISMKGTEFRQLFSLRSANFKVEKENDSTLKITTVGYGHGVGMSQWGANYLAKKGASFEEILKYYYSGVELSTINGYDLPVSSVQIY